jgi:hypothetical protein
LARLLSWRWVGSDEVGAARIEALFGVEVQVLLVVVLLLLLVLLVDKGCLVHDRVVTRF